MIVQLVGTDKNVRFLEIFRSHDLADNFPGLGRHQMTRGVQSTTYYSTPNQVVLALGDYMGVNCHACIGGTNVQQDIRVLEAGQHVVVGTPGRVYDMINRQALDPR